ncbi:MAG: tetratricopeptide repeat protein [Candidatus Promineifilaceae bacterium]|nr:tetratricopeptide repeat protein [Candidatus Promineifilaceae bacterium]
MARQKQFDPAESFNKVLRDALEHYNDVTWLDDHSILATPYYLGRSLESLSAGKATRNRRGQALQSVLWHAATLMWPGRMPSSRQSLLAEVDKERHLQGHSGPRYKFLLLDLRYLRRYFPPRTYPAAATTIPDFLGVSSTRFYVHLAQAVSDLGALVLDQLQPELRLEQPLTDSILLGRDEVKSAVLEELGSNKSVTISGVSGIGKSSLGAAVAANWSEGPCFWFTVHPGLNDDLHSIIFSVAHFLNQSNHSTLWLQMLANNGEIGSLEQLLGLLRADLQAAKIGQFLFCFDEIDLLRTTDNEPRKRAHIQILEFLESLQQVIPLLLIGQRALIDTESHHVLGPLSMADAGQLFTYADVHLEQQALQRIYTYTRGNPRLLELVLAFIKSGGKENELPGLAGDALAKPLFHRLWKRLDVHEKSILNLLSVMRSYIPAKSRPESAGAIATLIQRKLIKPDLGGGIILVSFFRQLIYFDLLAEHRQLLHKEAAAMRAQLGEFTAAAFHFWKAEDYDSAVAVWFPHQEHEIRRGQGSAAHEIFRNIAPNRLKGQRRRQLKVIQGRLYLLAGEAERALEGLEEYTWHQDEEITADALTQMGTASGILGRDQAAAAQYEEAINTLTRLTSKIAEQHVLLSMVFLREGDNQAARREVIVARHDIDRLQGLIAYATADFENARKYLDKALAAARLVDDNRRIALTHQHLAMVAGRQGDIESASQHADASIEIFQEIGDRLKAEGVRAEFAGVYLNNRQFEKYVQLAARSLRFFEQIKHERWLSVLSNNLAEAYMELGDLEQAKEFAYRVLRLENERSLPYTHYTLGLVFEKEHQYDRAEQTLQQGILLAQQIEDKFIEAYLQRALGQLLVRRRKDVQGNTVLQSALHLFEAIGLTKEVEITAELLQTTASQRP